MYGEPLRSLSGTFPKSFRNLSKLLVFLLLLDHITKYMYNTRQYQILFFRRGRLRLTYAAQIRCNWLLKPGAICCSGWGKYAARPGAKCVPIIICEDKKFTRNNDTQ